MALAMNPEAMQKFASLPEQEAYQVLAQKQFAYLSVQAAEYPIGHSLFLLAKLLYENPPAHVTIVEGKDFDFEQIRKKLPFLANISVLQEQEKYHLINGKTTYYVCRNHVCLLPVNTPDFAENPLK